MSVWAARFNQRIARLAIGLVAVLATVGVVGAGHAAPASSDSGPSASAAGMTRWTARVERRMLRCTNNFRAANGRGPVRMARALRAAAHTHARNMVRYHFFGHTDQMGRDLMERVARFHPRLRFHWIGENLAGGQRSAKAVCRAWMQSPSHREIMLGGYRWAGFGFWAGGEWGRTYVQIFARLR